MTTYGDAYQGNFLEAADLAGREVQVKIEKVAPPNSIKSEDGRPITKPVLYFEGASKGLILNKTNAKRIVLFYCPRAKTLEEWIGTKITLHNEEDRRPDMGGARGPCVRVKMPKR